MALISLDTWADAALHGLDEAAMGVLGATTSRAGKSLQECPPGLAGPHIAVLSRSNTVRFGLSAPMNSWLWITMSMLDVQTGEDVERWDVVDAANEFCNIVAGRIKSVMLPHDPDLVIGLPHFIEGRILPTPDWDVVTSPVDVDGHTIHVCTIHNRVHGAELAA